MTRKQAPVEPNGEDYVTARVGLVRVSCDQRGNVRLSVDGKELPGQYSEVRIILTRGVLPKIELTAVVSPSWGTEGK